MTMTEITTLKMNLLGGMVDYIFEVIGDDEITEYWLAYGVPDGADEGMLKEIAEDEDDFAEICKVFGKCVQADKEANH